MTTVSAVTSPAASFCSNSTWVITRSFWPYRYSVGLWISAPVATMTTPCSTSSLSPFLREARLEVAHEAVHCRRPLRPDASVICGWAEGPLDHLRQELLRVLAVEEIPNVPRVAAQLGLALDQVDAEALVGQGQGGRHPGHAAADDQGVVIQRQRPLRERLDQAGLGHRHPHQRLGLLRGLLRLVHVDPGALVADVGHLEEVRVQAGLPERVAEQRLVRARRAGGDDHAVQPMLLDGLANLCLAVRGAGVEVVLGVERRWAGSGRTPRPPAR